MSNARQPRAYFGAVLGLHCDPRRLRISFEMSSDGRHRPPPPPKRRTGAPATDEFSGFDGTGAANGQGDVFASGGGGKSYARSGGGGILVSSMLYNTYRMICLTGLIQT